MTKKEFYSELRGLLGKMSDDDLVSLHNACAKERGGRQIYTIWEAEDFFFPYDLRAGRKAGVGYDPNDYYFVLMETGMPRSFSDLSEPCSPYDGEKLIEAIYDCRQSCGIEEIEALLKAARKAKR